MTEKATKKVENEVWLAYDNQIIAKFGYSDVEGVKMPARAADAYLRSVLEDKTHQYHQALLDGKIVKMPGHPEEIKLVQKLSF